MKKEDPKFNVISFDGEDVQTKTLHTNPDTIANRIAIKIETFRARYPFEPAGIILGLLDYIDLLSFFEKHREYSSGLRYEERFMGLKICVSGAIRCIECSIEPSMSLRLAPGIIQKIKADHE